MSPTPNASEPVQPASAGSVNAHAGPLMVVFLLLTLVFVICWKLFSRSPVDYVVLLVGNGLLFFVSMASQRMSVRAMKAAKTQGFLRGVYGSFMLKFFVLAVAAFVYILHMQQAINKPAFFGCFGLYLIYTFVETRGVMRANTRTNA